jgi:CubicO group peptidase (beta-lactamase class C family)
LAIADGKLSLDDSVLTFFPESAPAHPSDNLKAMRVRDLLTMSTGQSPEDVGKISSLAKDNLKSAFLALPVDRKPGTFFVYNTPATYMLSAIVQKVTGATTVDFLEPRLFEPLGIDHPRWSASSEGITLGGIGLNLRTEDVARFGSIYLHKGIWNGKPLVPGPWVEAATARQTSNGSNPESDSEQGYGFQFWRGRHGTYRGDGAYGQFCIVMPDQDAVVAITSGTRNAQSVMNLVWDKLLSAMQARPLPANPTAREKLEHSLAGMTLHLPQGSATSAMAAQVSGKTYAFPANGQDIETLAIEFHQDDATLVVHSRGREYRIETGYGAWKKGVSTFTAGADTWLAEAAPQRIAASGAWTAQDVYTMKLALYETPLAVTLTCRFAGERLLVVKIDYSVEFGATQSTLLLGDAR